MTNHTRVLLCIADDPDVRLRDIAASVGITVGSAQRILSELVEAGFAIGGLLDLLRPAEG